MTKYCPGCEQDLDVAFFHKNRSRYDGLGNYCISCINKHRKTKYKQRINTYKRIQINDRREETREKLINYLLNHPCVDCGNSDFRVLEFDHIFGNKNYNISDMIGYKWQTILSEIAKCEVVCANCHVIRTYKRDDSYKQKEYIRRV